MRLLRSGAPITVGMASPPPPPIRRPLGVVAGLRLFLLWAPIVGYGSLWLLDGSALDASLLFIARWSIAASWSAMLLAAALEGAWLRRKGGDSAGLAVVVCTLVTILVIDVAVLLFSAMIASFAAFD